MPRILIVAVLICSALFSAYKLISLDGDELAEEISAAKLLEWPDLVPDAQPLADPLSDAPMHIRFDLGFIGKVVTDADAGVISRQGPEYVNAMMLLEKHRSDGIDVDKLLAAVSDRDQVIEQRGEAINQSLDGQLVRLPGYALPLEMGEGGVTEFLLVPFVGACIHVPPPPPNQIVLAQLESAYKVNGLYDPVLITGQLNAQTTSTELFHVDGEAQVPMGYSMQVLHIEPLDEKLASSL